MGPRHLESREAGPTSHQNLLRGSPSSDQQERTGSFAGWSYNTHIMAAAPRLTRSLLVGLLALSLSGATVVPPLMAVGGAVTVTDSEAANAEVTCCCGTPDARCCGTTCCERPARTPRPSPPTERSEQDRTGSPTFHLPAGAASLISGSQSATRLQPVSAATPREGASLQAQQVRLDV